MGRAGLRWFALAELCLGVYGALSLPLLHLVGGLTLRLPPSAIALVAFLLVLAPTLLMGATLPLLVAHAVADSANVGDSVGELYSVNTLGSACASLAAALFLLAHLGQLRTTLLAAGINLVVAAVVLRSRAVSRRASAAGAG